MEPITREALSAYRDRWISVADVETQELRQMTMVQAFQQLETLRRRARLLGLLEQVIEDNADEVATVRQRWNILRCAPHA